MFDDSPTEPDALGMTVIDDCERERILLEAEQAVLFRTHEMVVSRLIEIEQVLDALSPQPSGYPII
jgi:hypothetical protein